MLEESLSAASRARRRLVPMTPGADAEPLFLGVHEADSRPRLYQSISLAGFARHPLPARAVRAKNFCRHERTLMTASF